MARGGREKQWRAVLAGKLKAAIWVGGVVLLLTAWPVAADVLFTHQIQSYDYMLGETDIRMRVGYTDKIKYTDKETRYQAGFLKRFFGKVKTGRSSSEFNLNEETVSEVDWENRYIYTYPLSRICDPEWHRRRTPFAKERDAFVKERYEVAPPKISFSFADEPERVNGYTARRVDIHLDLETLDKKKNAQSVTRITQSLWLTGEVAGYGLYTGFSTALSSKTGVDRYRLGPLGDLLSNFPGDLGTIEPDLSNIQGYAVKSRFVMEGSYVQNFEDKPSKTISKVLKDETMVLKEVTETAALDTGLFLPPASFSRKMVE